MSQEGHALLPHCAQVGQIRAPRGSQPRRGPIPACAAGDQFCCSGSGVLLPIAPEHFELLLQQRGKTRFHGMNPYIQPLPPPGSQGTPRGIALRTGQKVGNRPPPSRELPLPADPSAPPDASPASNRPGFPQKIAKYKGVLPVRHLCQVQPFLPGKQAHRVPAERECPPPAAWIAGAPCLQPPARKGAQTPARAWQCAVVSGGKAVS